MSTIIVRQGSTGTYHRGFANCPGITLCNHSGQPYPERRTLS